MPPPLSMAYRVDQEANRPQDFEDSGDRDQQVRPGKPRRNHANQVGPASAPMSRAVSRNMAANEIRNAVHHPKENGIPSRPRMLSSKNNVRRRMNGVIYRYQKAKPTGARSGLCASMTLAVPSSPQSLCFRNVLSVTVTE